MGDTSVDQRYELVLGFELCVKNVACHVYELEQLHLLAINFVVFHFELKILTLGLQTIDRGSLYATVALIHTEYCTL